MKHLSSVLFLLACSILSFAQSGSISGKVIDGGTGEDIIGAIVQIQGTAIGAATDVFGEFKMNNVQPGTYTVECRLVSYQPKAISGVVVESGKTTALQITLEEQAIEGITIEIVEFKKTNTEAAVLLEMKEAKGVVSGMSNAQIAKGQDRNASEVARRIPGVTVIDNRFVMVRGLAQRYNAVMLNGILVPSLESDTRSFSFDVIPSQAIDRFLIYKSPSPDLPGEFAGGAINVYTKNFPDYKTTLDVSLGGGWRKGTTSKEFAINERGSSEKFGYNNDRKLPSDFPENVRTVADPAQLQEVGRSLPNSWDYTMNKAPLDKRVAVTIGKRMKLRDAILGNFTSINYSNTYQKLNSRRLDYNVFDTVLNNSDTVFAYNDNIYQNQVNVGLLQNWGLKLKNHTFEFKNFLNQNGLQSNTLRTGKAIEEGNYRKEYSFRYTQRTLFTTQLSGTHQVFHNNGTFNWTFGYGATRRQDPDWKRIRYTKPLDGSDPQYHAYVPFSAQPFFLGRLFMNLKEDIRTYAANYEHKLYQTDDSKDHPKYITAKVGFYYEDKDRRFGSRNIGYAPASIFQFDYSQDIQGLSSILAPQNINNTTGFKLDEDTRGSDTYHASNTLLAYYAMVSIPYKKWNISGGARFENNKQAITSADVTGTPIDVLRDSLIVLPSVNISYNFSEKTLLRFAYGKTVNRPEFRELAPFSFYDFENNFIITGNPQLNFAVIDNIDLRWEMYPSPTEFVSLAGFYKRFQNPIEQYFVPGVGSGGTRSFAPGNALAATSYGAEIDVRKSFQNMSNKKFIQNLAVVANASYIFSDITLSPEGLETGLNPNRPMVGQSPYIINGGLYWENDSIGLQISALYNVVGPRVVIVGIPDVPEVYEMPRQLLDFAVTKTFRNGFGLRFGVQDALNQQFMLLQDANADGILSKKDDQRIQDYRRGAYFSFSIQYHFTEK